MFIQLRVEKHIMGVIQRRARLRDKLFTEYGSKITKLPSREACTNLHKLY